MWIRGLSSSGNREHTLQSISPTCSRPGGGSESVRERRLLFSLATRLSPFFCKWRFLEEIPRNSKQKHVISHLWPFFHIKSEAFKQRNCRKIDKDMVNVCGITLMVIVTTFWGIVHSHAARGARANRWTGTCLRPTLERKLSRPVLSNQVLLVWFSGCTPM